MSLSFKNSISVKILHQRMGKTILFLIFLLGCAGEKDPYVSRPVVDLKNGQLQCLTNFDQSMADFFVGQLADSKIENLWNCIDVAIVQFLDSVRGKDGQNYTPYEMASFLDQLFLNKRGLAGEEDFLQEMMEVKKLFIGGSTTSMTYEDLNTRTRRLLPEFKQVMLSLNPHMKVIKTGFVSFSPSYLFSEEETQSAIQALFKAAEKLSSLISSGDYVYNFTHALRLLDGFERFAQKKDSTYSLLKGKQYLSLLNSLKGLLVGPPMEGIRHQEWPGFLGMVARIISWDLKYRLSMQSSDWRQPPGLYFLSNLAQDLITELHRGLSLQPDQVFKYVDLDPVLKALEKLDFLPLGLDAPTMGVVLRKLGQQVLSRDGSTEGFDRADLVDLQHEVERWFSLQHYAGHFLKDPRAPDHPGPELEFYQLITASPWALKVDNLGRLDFSKDVLWNQGAYDLKSLTTLNWQMVVIRLLIKSFNRPAQNDNSVGLTLPELSLLSEDWHVLAEKLGFFKVGQSDKMAKKIFMEANLFVPSGNGDSWQNQTEDNKENKNNRLDFAEAVQYLSFVVSGMSARAQVWSHLAHVCEGFSEESLTLSPTCFRQEMFRQRGYLLNHLPFLVEYLAGNFELWSQYESMAETVTRGEFNDRPLSRGDVVEIFVLFQYIETFFARFDRNQNQSINVEETALAYTVFRPIFETLVMRLGFSGEDAYALFTYLFKYGKPPSSAYMGGSVSFLNWLWTKPKWQYETNRLGIIQILAELNKIK